MDEEIRWGIVGPGRIAEKVVEDFAVVPGARPVAVASRSIHRAGAEPETITRPPRGAGYSHELVEVTEGVRAGRSESGVMPLADTLAVQTVLGEAAEQLGVRHAEAPELG